MVCSVFLGGSLWFYEVLVVGLWLSSLVQCGVRVLSALNHTPNGLQVKRLLTRFGTSD